jgi:NAD(P)-dependent dehydrogenase (short-subunit alcohol dehydrogenase family)
MDLGLAGKAFCVAGGSRGIGWATAQLLAEEGAGVAILSRSAEPITAACDELAERYGVPIKPIASDITLPGAATRAVTQARSVLGRLDGLAVTTHGEAHSPPFVSMDDEVWIRQFADVLLGPICCARAILPEMVAQRGGSIVFTGAYSARAPGASIIGYAAMKAAIVNLTKSLAKAHGADGIRVNAVCPGFIATERAKVRLAELMYDEHRDRASAEKMLLERSGMVPALGRLGSAREVAELIVFLLSDRAAYATGLIANIDGGTDF